MKDLNAIFQPEKIGHAHGLQISYQQEGRGRNVFVYHDNGQVRTRSNANANHVKINLVEVVGMFFDN